MMICLLIWSPVMHRQAEAVTADEMVKTTGVSHGICSILGAKGSDLGLKLAQSGNFMVHVIGLNTEAVAMARKDVDQQGLYGKKIIVEKGTPGLEVGKKENKLGLRASDTCELYFDNCKISKGNLIGEESRVHLLVFLIFWYSIFYCVYFLFVILIWIVFFMFFFYKYFYIFI